MHEPATYAPALNIEWTETRRRNRELSDVALEERAAEVDALPRILFIEVTENCNLHCPMCRLKRRIEPRFHMAPELFRSVAEHLFPTAEVIDLRGWGESLLYPDIDEVLRYAAGFGGQLKLYTNLTVGRPAVLDALMECDVITAVSFDASEEDTFRDLRGGAKIDVVLRNLATLVERREAWNRDPDRVYLSTVVSRSNLEQLPEIVRIAAEHELPLVKLFPYCGEPADPEHPFGDAAGVSDAIDRLQAVAAETGVAVHFGATPHPDFTVDDALFSMCSHPWTHCYVRYDGQVGFCDHLIGMEEYCLGQWSDAGFAEVWNGPLFRQLRAEHTGGAGALSDRFEACRWCYGCRFADVEHWLRPDQEKRIVTVDRIAADRARAGRRPPPTQLRFP